MSIRKQVTIELDGAKRTLACDLNAGDTLFDSVGPHWVLWLAERFIGQKTKGPDGKEKYHLVDLRPRETALALYAMLATDREDRQERGEEIQETVQSLRRAVNISNESHIRLQLTNAILASFHIPGEAVEAAASVEGGPHFDGHAKTPGTGERS
jgi:hypothetical protein